MLSHNEYVFKKSFLRSSCTNAFAQMPLHKCLAVLSFLPIYCTILFCIAFFKELLNISLFTLF